MREIRSSAARLRVGGTLGPDELRKSSGQNHDSPKEPIERDDGCKYFVRPATRR